MKIFVKIVIGIFIVYMSYVFIGGYIQKNNIESNPSTNQNKAQPSTTGATTKTYTTNDVAKHNSPNDCWLIINNNIYDVTTFLGQHPGGASTITPYCGREATQAFDTKDRGSGNGHSSSANSMLVDYLIGSIK